jgi:hypothetical protein
MRYILLGALAGVVLASTPVLAGPLQINANLGLFGTPNQTITGGQHIWGDNHIVSFGDPTALQVGINGELGSDATQSIDDTQYIGVHGVQFGTVATQVGANVALGGSITQSITQTQSVDQHGLTGGSQATQVGVNVAVGTTGGSQSITTSQSVH